LVNLLKKSPIYNIIKKKGGKMRYYVVDIVGGTLMDFTPMPIGRIRLFKSNEVTNLDDSVVLTPLYSLLFERQKSGKYTFTTDFAVPYNLPDLHRLFQNEREHSEIRLFLSKSLAIKYIQDRFEMYTQCFNMVHLSKIASLKKEYKKSQKFRNVLQICEKELKNIPVK
jgi:hypothetical protein